MTIPSGPYIALPDNTEVIKQRVQTTALNTLKLNDSELGGSGEVVTIQSLNGTVEVSSTTIGTDSLVRASAMQAALTTKQDVLVSASNIKTINGSTLLGSGDLVVSGGLGSSFTKAQLDTAVSDGNVVFVGDALNGTLGATTPAAVACTTLVASSTATASEFKVTGSQSFGVYSSGSNRTGLFFDGGGGTIRLLLASGGYFGIGSSSVDANTTDSTISRQSAGVVQIGTTAANALGSLACANVTASGTVTTPKVENTASAVTINGNGKVQFQTGGFDRFQVGPGNDFYPSTTNAYNVGGLTNRVLGFYGGLLDLTGSAKIGAGTAILKVLSATATLDFGSVAANSFADLTITVTGAALGDTVSIGVPNGSLLNDISFFGWVSATNTVTVRCSNVSSTTARDPAIGTFRATVTQF